ncbi:putative udp-glucose flavonoid 3-o-glucosyltransferase 3 [Nicotiana attenuata]|uniref:Udp-glucose flavonoid 3-o-glucosyltransferase 3 n=1 Tax=Nicotiana attenuata TaxID=49451 RepID=A0A1J6K007_NICAT|nr:putative udp-glucose flavonoid 3-o-glucosyltransferase 3 [Nicotiana attenuata]
MTTKAELVFIPAPGAGPLISTVQIAKLILDRDERLCISVLIMKLPMDFGTQSYVESLSSTVRLKFVDITVDEKTTAELMSNKETFFLDFIRGHKPKEVPQIYPVGPVVNFKEGGHGQNSQSETESIIKWLDDKPESSVVFLCFGSMGSFEPEQVKEIAIALECSGHRFLWSLRRPPPKGKMELPSNYENFEEVLPEGFIERTNGVGKVIGWAPQVTVLSHPAVGGFVSHCGWNSILESFCFGVPMATWPHYAEQQMNAFALVKELELAVEIRMVYVKDFEGKNPVDIVTAKEIESGIRQLMADGDKNGIRKKVKEMKEKCSAAMKEGGSSYASLGLLIEDVISNIS